MNSLIKNNKNLEEIIRTVYNNGFKVYIVGGAVRDHLLGLNPKDIDLATDATPPQLQKIFTNRKVKLVGESFGVILVDDFEIATFRNDRHFGIGDENCEVLFAKTIEEDLKRRDFTINAMAYCPNTSSLIDLHGGFEDLKRRTIRFVENPATRISEDPNRIIRACRFAAKIDGEIENRSFIAISESSSMIYTHVKPERIRLEILKAMQTKEASVFFNYLLISGCLKYIFPSLHMCHESGDHGHFHTEDIYTHNMVTGDHISTKYSLLKLAGYLHDVGKPLAYNEGSFHSHEKIGKDLIEVDLKDLKFSNGEIEYISNLIRCHMYSLKDISPKATRKLVKKLKDRDVSFHDFLRLKIADRNGNISKNPHAVSELKEYHKKLFNAEIKDCPFNAKDLDIDGNEIMKHFGLNPGKEVGNILTHLLNHVIENGNESNTYEKLLMEAEGYYDAGQIVEKN